MIIPNVEVGEQDGESDYDYFGARYYNSNLGIWLQVDPLAEKYPGWRPFNYVMNNPMRLIDPNGNEIVDAKGRTITVTRNNLGELMFSKNVTQDVKKCAFS